MSQEDVIVAKMAAHRPQKGMLSTLLPVHKNWGGEAPAFDTGRPSVRCPVPQFPCL
jgi:hypothetical protein